MFETPSREERETILDYDFASHRWTIYSDVIKDVNKYHNMINKSLTYTYGYNSKHNLTMIRGTLKDDINIGVHLRRNLTDKQRQELSERMSNMRKQIKLKGHK